MRTSLFAILLLFSFVSHAQDFSACASTLGELRALVGDPLFPSRWAEITMDDGKPLVVSIGARKGALVLEFMKAGEGLWAEIYGVICKTGVDFEARMPREQIRLGPAANWVLGLALANGGVFTLRRRVPDQLQIETPGWSGRFTPSAKN